MNSDIKLWVVIITLGETAYDNVYKVLIQADDLESVMNKSKSFVMGNTPYYSRDIVGLNIQQYTMNSDMVELKP
jgi:hypothetical protein